MIQTISEAEMIQKSKFFFGKGFIKRNKLFAYEPDAPQTQNGHMMIVGGSGAGKTRLLKKIIAFLQYNNKQIYIIDFHGDISILNETLYKFTSRNSQYGLNFFEFEKDSKNGGVEAQVNIIVSIFKKNFLPNMGAVQKSVLKQFLLDCYKYVGITDEDESTWDKPIPDIETFYNLYQMIQNKIENGVGDSIVSLYKKLTLLQEKYQKEIDQTVKERLEKQIEKIFDKIYKKNNRLYRYIFLERDEIDDEDEISLLKQEFDIQIENIDISFYLDPSVQKIFKSLYPYVNDLYKSSVFSDKKPPAAKGVVRYDISGFTNIDKPLEAMFFADIMIQKIFRAYKLRGEYRLLPQEHKNKKGQKVDTYIVIDESKLVLPTGKDKENPYNILNRIVTEARKFGIGLIVVSQRPDHFPQEMISSIYTKVVLRINENDVNSANKLLGVKDKMLFEHLKTFGVALVGTSGGNYDSVALPWASEK